MATIRTNNVPRDFIDWYQLTKKEQAEFDYLDNQLDQDSAMFVRYKGCVYDVGQATVIRPEDDPLGKQGWHGFFSESAFHATLFKVVNDYNQVVCGQYFT